MSMTFCNSDSRFSVDPQTLLTRLGGSISSGRTLLWILLSIFGAFQVEPLLLFFGAFQVKPFSSKKYHFMLLSSDVEDVPTTVRS